MTIKRIVFLFVAFIFPYGVAHTQTGNIIKAENALEMENITKALGAIGLAMNHEKSKDNHRTWFVRGKIYHAIAKSNDPEIQALAEDPVGVAIESFNKAMELDEKNRLDMEFKLLAAGFQNICINKGIEGFNNNDYEEALKYFEYSLAAGQFPGLKTIIDTSLMYNAGIAAFNAKKYETAISYFKNSAQYNYGKGNEYILIKNSYMALGDTAKAIGALQEGLEKSPDNQFIVIDLINYYLSKNKTDKALEYLALAKEKDPDNATFYFAEATLYEKEGENDKAFEAYNKAIELKPEYYDAYFNLGVMYYNIAVEMNDSAMDVADNQEYAEAKKKVDEEFKKSIPYLEKAHELQPDNLTNMETLSSLYFRLQMEEEDKAMLLKLKDAYETTYQENQDNVKIMKKLANIYHRLEMTAKRDEMAAKIKELTGEDYSF